MALGIRILIGCDVRLYSEGISQFLSGQPGVAIVGVADRSEAVLQQLEQLGPDIVLLDQGLPDSLDTLRQARRLRPDCRVIALGVPEQEEALLAWAEAGVAGLVPRNASVEDLHSTIASAVRGELHCSPSLAGTLLRRLASRADAAKDVGSGLPLTIREAEIVTLIDQGLSNKEIAVKLGIEVPTVKNHVHNLLSKLQVHRRAEAAARLRGKSSRRIQRSPSPED
jgi:two-component system, NarL family, nitrate/nitrite response regulator NarL